MNQTLLIDVLDSASAADFSGYSKFDALNSPLLQTLSFNTRGVTTIGVRVTDGDGGEVTDSFDVTVLNAVPILDFLSGDTSVLEGATVPYAATASDLDPSDVLTFEWDLDEFKKHFLGLSDNVTYFAEQVDAKDVSIYHYRVIFKPQTILPDVDFRGDAGELLSSGE